MFGTALTFCQDICCDPFRLHLANFNATTFMKSLYIMVKYIDVFRYSLAASDKARYSYSVFNKATVRCLRVSQL